MYQLRSKKTGIFCGWSLALWNTGGFELADDESGMDTPPKVLASIEEATGLKVGQGVPQPTVQPGSVAEPVGVLTPAEPAPAAAVETTVTDAADPANVPSSMFAADTSSDAEDNS